VVNVRRVLGVLAVLSFATPVGAQVVDPIGDVRAPTSESPTDPGWVLLESGWRPIVTVGYRLQRARPRDLGATGEVFVEHGMTVGILLPVIASGASGSRARVALGIGMGVDRAKDREPSLSGLGGTATTLSLATYAQLGAILRVARSTTWSWLATALWTPGRSSAAITYSGLSQQGWGRTAARGRATFGVVVRGVHLGLLVGGAYWSGEYEGAAGPAERTDLELGLQLGSGW
jgi:hypothetical protein